MNELMNKSNLSQEPTPSPKISMLASFLPDSLPLWVPPEVVKDDFALPDPAFVEGWRGQDGWGGRVLGLKGSASSQMP